MRQMQTRIDDGEGAAVDNFRRQQSDFPSEAECLRRLIELGLEAYAAKVHKQERERAAPGAGLRP